MRKINRNTSCMNKPRMFFVSKVTRKLCSSVFILFLLFAFSASSYASCTFGNVTGGIFNWNAEITVVNEGAVDVVGWDVTWTFDINSPNWQVNNTNANGEFLQPSNSSPTFTATTQFFAPVSFTISPGETVVISVQGGGGVALPSVSTPLTGPLCGPAATIIATDDVAATPVNGTTGGTIAENVLTNDTLNGVTPINSADVVITTTTAGPLTVNADGSVDVAAGTAAGTFTAEYEICEVAIPTNCATAEVTVEVFLPAVVAQICDTATQLFGDDFGTGGITDSAEVQNHTFITGVNPQDGFYNINDPANVTAFFLGGGNLLDNTPGDVNGRALIINMLNAPVVFYENTVNGILPNTDVTFQVWVNGACPNCPDQGEVELIVEDLSGNVVASSGSAPVPNNQVWTLRNFSFNSGANTDFVIKLRNAASSGSAGNDLLIDDIAFCQGANLTLVKSITNDDGGIVTDPDAFSLTIDGDVVLSGAPTSIQADTPVAINETALAGYAFESITGDDCPIALGGTITLASGVAATCTITNNDIPARLTIVKSITNDNGGTVIDPDAFLLTVDGASVSSGVAINVQANTPLAINETALAGYAFESMSGAGCPTVLGGTITLAPSTSATCTIVNNDIPGSLTVEKIITSDDGGTATLDDFDISVNGVEIAWTNPTSLTGGSEEVSTAAGTYSLTETVVTDYTNGTFSCTGAADTDVSDGNITVAAGETVVCSVTNDDIGQNGTIIIEKQTLPDGSPQSFDFTGDITASLTDGVSSTPLDVPSGTYTVTENAIANWSLTSIACDDTDSTGDINTATATFNVAVGETITCVFTNTQSASLTLNKIVNNTVGGGTAIASDWTLEANTSGGAAELSGATGVSSSALIAGDYVLTETAGPVGYRLDSLVCDVGFLDSGTSTLTLAPGDVSSCTFTNRDLITDLQITKTVSDINPVPGGLPITFTLTVVNNGPDDATNVIIDDTVLTGFTFVPSSMTGGDTQNQTAPGLVWTINSLPAGAANAVILNYQASVNNP